MSPGDLLAELVHTALRLFPWPTEPGLRRVGNPGPSSPVLITGNYDLTVRRLLRALEGVDAWLVVARSGGINVWCAAAGGHLGTHQVVTALKTSGIEQHVSHHRAILPQLAATGVIAREVSRRCGWRVRFGPVYAEDIPRFLAQREKKDDEMRRVRFGVRERLEMAGAWGLPAALLLGATSALLHPAWAAPLALWALVLASGVFLGFDRLPGRRPSVLGAIAIGVALAVVALAGGGSGALVAAGVVTAGLVALLTFDYSGSTPLEGGSHFESREWSISLDLERCAGVYSCWEVCPEACFEKREDARKVDLAHDERCVRCGACVVQCPQDALFFAAEDGRRIAPETIRRFKMNLFGKRSIEQPAEGRSPMAGGSAASRPLLQDGGPFGR
jgi:NAD-dependent dihydropyrimidine dehydrogenase PreA subunit